MNEMETTHYAEITDPTERQAAINAERDYLFAAIKPAQDRLRTLGRLLDEAREERAEQIRQRVEAGGNVDLCAIFDIAWDHGRGSKAGDKALKSYLHRLGYPGYVSGGWRTVSGGEGDERMYYSPKIFLDRRMNPAKRKGLATVLAKYAKAVQDAYPDMTRVDFEVLDHECGEEGTWTIHYDAKTGTGTLGFRRYSREVETPHPTMDDLLVATIRAGGWYSEPEDDDSDYGKGPGE